MLLESTQLLQGTPISRGVAIGKLFFFSRPRSTVLENPIQNIQVDSEIKRFHAAISTCMKEIEVIQKQLSAESASEAIAILETQREILQDPLMIQSIEEGIRKENKSAENAINSTIDQFQKKFQKVSDPFFSQRFQDLQGIGHILLNSLKGASKDFVSIPPCSIVCASELTALDAARVKGCDASAFLVENGGATSHAAIIAKSKGIPYLTNVDLAALKASNFEGEVIVDGRSGKIILNPDEDTLNHYECMITVMQRQKQDLERVAKWPAETYDGYRVRLSANLELAQEADQVCRMGGEGVGLFRSEFLMVTKNEFPSEEEQFLHYKHLIEKMQGRPVVIRTFDLCGDKMPLAIAAFEGKNPFQSSGATRYLLKEKTILQSQIRAILRASQYGEVAILFPMIATLSELRGAKQLVQEAQAELNLHQPIRIGCMIEVPSSAIAVDHFVQECDFLSIGTNDLVQYTLAIDRSDQFHDPSEPSLLRMIKHATLEADRMHIPVSICGEMASDPRFTPLLLGLGVQELSVSPHFLPVIKNAIRNTSLIEAVQLAEKALQMKTAAEVLQLLQEA